MKGPVTDVEVKAAKPMYVPLDATQLYLGGSEGRFGCEVRGEVWYHRRNWLVLGLNTTSGRKTVPDDGGCVTCDV